MKPLEAIRCTHPNCTCECFSPEKQCIRTCESCKHGWVTHALDKLGFNHVFNLGMQVEVVQPNIVFDIASLMLYGSHATPVRLKILLDRLFSVLQHDEVLQVLHGFGWKYEDYARGYILQDSSGRVLDKWVLASKEEENIIIQQFLRFGETKAIAQEILLQGTKETQDLYIKQTTRADSEIKKFMERSNMTMHNYMRSIETRQLFPGRFPFNIPPVARLMTPPGLPSSFSPSGEIRPLVLPSTSTPITTSPLNRLQTMQPFEYHRDHGSPNPSPNPLEKPVTVTVTSPCASPKNLSTTSTSVNSSPSPVSNHKFSESDGENIIISSLSSKEEPTQNAIDYSTKDDSYMSDLERKAKHMRKSSNPIKRQWQPSAGFGSTFMGPNGKKRTLCSACNKTFCDKGALKIHYSAVHLKEMHKCTVDGCNMMFSSRRSRNRHSANPNPKLHMPQKRKEDSPRMDDSNGMSDNPPTMVLPHMIPRNPMSSMDSPGMIQPDPRYFLDLNNQLPYFPSPEKWSKLELSESEDEPKDLSNHSNHGDNHDRNRYNDANDGDAEDGRSEMMLHKGGSRRKNNAPTRCTQSDDMYVMSDDNSDDKDPNERSHQVRSRSGTFEGRRSDEYQPEKRFKTEPKSGLDNSDDMDMGNESDDEKPVTPAKKNGKSDTCNFPKIASLLTNSLPVRCCPPITGSFSSPSEECPSPAQHDSDQESNDSTDSLSPKENGDYLDLSASEIPIDKENPKKCVACGKSFGNAFGVKIHYQNVHLKLMHPCSIDGCNARFPSKRSRNRHASNLNLHRKLLSTEGDLSDKNNEGSVQDLREDIIKQLYGPQHLIGYGKPESNRTNGRKSPTSDGRSNHSKEEEDEDEGEADPDDKMDTSATEKESPEVNGNDALDCHICDIKFEDSLALQEHFESSHPKETIQNGREKIFTTTRKSRSRHRINGNLHSNMVSGIS
ncbi:hypothetical protein SNE40_012513 [Patella caerulea]|uniref:C2H2-type domain-containing protein n=1 Tax=Patella caerulea TaxID=87958 RepID=A0AAN8PW22_PATCE